MNEPLNENDMKAEFRQLRETEMRVAPGYRQTANGPAVAAPRRRIRPAIQFALLALMLVAGGAVLFDSGNDQPGPESAKAGPIPFEMPTDFLLDTPWFDLAATTPDFDFEFPQYDIPEDPSDEI